MYAQSHLRKYPIILQRHNFQCRLIQVGKSQNPPVAGSLNDEGGGIKFTKVGEYWYNVQDSKTINLFSQEVNEVFGKTRVFRERKVQLQKLNELHVCDAGKPLDDYKSWYELDLMTDANIKKFVKMNSDTAQPDSKNSEDPSISEEENNQTSSEIKSIARSKGLMDTTFVKDSIFQIRWEFFCQAYADHIERLKKFYPELDRKGLKSLNLAFQSLIGISILSLVFASFTGVYMKFDGILRAQMMLSATSLCLCGGIVWGYEMGSQTKGLSNVRNLISKFGLLTTALGVLGLTISSYNYQNGYIWMIGSQSLSLITLYSLYRQSYIKFWIFSNFTNIFIFSIASNLMGLMRAPTVIRQSQSMLLKEDLETKFSLLGLLRRILPTKISQTVLKDA